jgi:hypothetical protein
MQQRIITSALYGAAAVIAALQVGIPSDKQGWLGIAVVFASAAWGKYSSNQTIVAPDRAVWSPEQRREELMAPLNKDK